MDRIAVYGVTGHTGRCHYLGHAAEPAHVKQIHESYGDADVVLIPGMSFYGALADLVAAELGDGLTDIQEIVVAYAVSGWLMTATSVATAAHLGEADSLVTTTADSRPRRTSGVSGPSTSPHRSVSSR